MCALELVMKDKKILVLDIDGTLVNSQKIITEKTLDALFEVQRKGHIVALASGRPYPGMRKYVEQIGLVENNGYALAFNGGRIVECGTGTIIHEQPVPKEYAGVIFDYAVKKDIGLVTYKDDYIVTGTRIDDYMQYEARLNYMTLRHVKDFKTFVDFDMVKCLMTAEPDIAAVCEEELKAMLGPKLNVFRSEPYFIEVTANGVDKAETISYLIDRLGISRDNLICCGDGFNDLTMVKYAGIGVAMGNAQQIVKDNADYITKSCDDDGIVDVINKFIL